MEKKTMGSFLSALRKTNGMTQQDVADRLGVTNRAVSRWERDEALPDITLIPALAEMFGVTCDELLKGERNGDDSGSELLKKTKADKQIKAMISNCRTELKKKIILFMIISHCGSAIDIGLNLNNGDGVELLGFRLGLAFWFISLLISAYIGGAAIIKANAVLNSEEILGINDKSFVSDFVETKNCACNHLKNMLIFMMILWIISLAYGSDVVAVGYILEIIAAVIVFTFRNIDLKKIL